MGTPSSNQGNLAQEQERNRQNLIKGGLSQINAIFGGGTYGVNPTNWSKGGSFFDPSGYSISTATTANDPELKAWLDSHPSIKAAYTGDPQTRRSGTGNLLYHMGQVGTPGLGSLTGGFNLFNPFGFGESKKTININQLRNLYGKWLGNSGELFSGTATSPGFGDDFYKKRTQDYINFAMPQLQDQAYQTQKNLIYKLSNQGLSSSGAADTLNYSLLNEINRQAAGVASTGVQQAQDLQKQIEQQRSQLISQLEASADPGSATRSALSTAAGFSAPSVFQPVGSLFGNWANTYLASQIPNSNPSYFPYLYGMGSSRPESSSLIPSNTVQN